LGDRWLKNLLTNNFDLIKIGNSQQLRPFCVSNSRALDSVMYMHEVCHA